MLKRYLARMERVLRRLRIDPQVISDLLREVSSHVQDSGDDPIETFGEPEAYALRRVGVAHSNLRTPWWPRLISMWLWWVAFATVANLFWNPGYSNRLVLWNIILVVGLVSSGLAIWFRNRPVISHKHLES